MGTEVAKATVLTPQQQEAAYWTAQGLNRREVREKMTDPASEKSIGEWRKTPEFVAEVEMFKTANRETLEAVVVSGQLEAIGLNKTMVDVLKRAATAKDDEGNEMVGMQMRAAELYFGKILPKLEAARVAGEQGPGQGAAVIVINMPDAPGGKPEIVTGEVVEAEVVG